MLLGSLARSKALRGEEFINLQPLIEGFLVQFGCPVVDDHKPLKSQENMIPMSLEWAIYFPFSALLVNFGFPEPQIRDSAGGIANSLWGLEKTSPGCVSGGLRYSPVPPGNEGGGYGSLRMAKKIWRRAVPTMARSGGAQSLSRCVGRRANSAYPWIIIRAVEAERSSRVGSIVRSISSRRSLAASRELPRRS